MVYKLMKAFEVTGGRDG